jgi:hypothetical protein
MEPEQGVRRIPYPVSRAPRRVRSPSQRLPPVLHTLLPIAPICWSTATPPPPTGTTGTTGTNNTGVFGTRQRRVPVDLLLAIDEPRLAPPAIPAGDEPALDLRTGALEPGPDMRHGLVQAQALDPVGVGVGVARAACERREPARCAATERGGSSSSGGRVRVRVQIGVRMGVRKGGAGAGAGELHALRSAASRRGDG